MSAPDYHTAANGKQPAAASSSTDQPRPQPAMIVQPPRQEDLQKSYATVVDPDANPKGWYGSMSMHPHRTLSLSLSLSLSRARTLHVPEIATRHQKCRANAHFF